MDCASCGRTNRSGNRFCSGCGQPLAQRCGACGAEVEPGAQFCGGCGASLAAVEPVRESARQSDAAGARKVVTIVFADLAGSTALHERLDAESVRRFMDAYYQAMHGAVEAHGGTVTQLLGDGVKAVFGAPRVAEDDAIRAVHAAVAMQRAFAELAAAQAEAVGRTGLRVAVNTGEVVANDATEIIGDPVNVAARLQEQARDGDVVIGEATRRLVSHLITLAPLGVFALKGRAESVAAYRVVSLDRPAGASATPFVGRDTELRQILAVYDDAVAMRRARLAVVLGSPGLGKSRVIGEVARRLGDAAILLSAHCDAAGGATFAPIADALRACLRIEEGASADAVRAALDAVLGDEADRGRIASGVAALLGGAAASPEETFFVVRRFLAALAAARPVVLAIDDLQWAEPLLLDLTEHLVQWSTEVPLLVLVAARPELREARSSLAARGGLVAEVVTLAGLDALAAMKLAANAIGAEELPAAVAGRVLATSEGNPLFVGELVRMLVQDGTLVREGERWTVGVELAGLEMPPTIQALLAARIERLRPDERIVLERAAVIGRQFSRAAVKELLPRESGDLDRLLESLRRSELVEPDTGWFLGEPALRFHHLLIRDAAYRRLLKNTRAELHERFADWVETRVGEAAAHDETLGWHLEQAHRHLRELGPIDAHGRALGERASRVLAAAGRRALARDDVPLAASLLGRALAALEAADPARAELALDWCEALLAAGEVGEAAAAIDELGRFAGDSPRLRAWHTCFAGERAALTDPQALRATAESAAAAADQLVAVGDAAGEAKAHFVHAIALARLGRVGACEAALDRALSAARRGGDHRRSNAVLSGAPQAALWGPSPVTRASGRCLDVVRVLRITRGSPAVEAIALRCQGVLEALRGRSEAARRMIATSRRMVEELGITQRLLEAEMFAGQIELYEGDAAAAEVRLRPAYEGLREHGLGIDAAQAAALLGRALLALGRASEAEALSHESEALAGDDLRAAVAWRGVRAEALARRGEGAAAVEVARAAVEIVAATDALLDHAAARTALGAALRSAGRGSEAAAEEARAIELWEAKGATLLVERARGERARATEPVTPAPVEPIVVRPGRARVLENAATANVARAEAAIERRDLDGFAAELADDFEHINHPHHLTYGRAGMVATIRIFLAAEAPSYRHESLATVGDSLVLCRVRLSAQRSGGSLDAGAYEAEGLTVIEVDAHGRRNRSETFASDQLGDAIVCLYERYAERLPDGPERERAAATARSAAVVLAPLDPDRWATVLSPSIEYAVQGPAAFPSGRGAESLMRAIRGFVEVGEVVANRTDEILALRPNALLRLGTSSGTDHAGGGTWERNFLSFWMFGADGLLTHTEMFEPDRAAEALARFDALTAGSTRVERRVQRNAATARSERVAVAINARDVDTFEQLCADEIVFTEHTTGGSYGRAAQLATVRLLLEAEDLDYRCEPLATLGDSLALCRISLSASGTRGQHFDVGPYSAEQITLIEVDAQGRMRSGEMFAPDRLGDAVVRLYERYAERLPAGPERDRAEATARSVTVTLAPIDPNRWATVISPKVVWTSQGPTAFPPGRYADDMLQAIRVYLEAGEMVTNRTNDVLALRPNALLRLQTASGIDAAGGGEWERSTLHLYSFGTDGLLARMEIFEPDNVAEALARFDALTGAPAVPARRVRPNAATALNDRVTAAIRARDVDALDSVNAEGFESIEHTTGATIRHEGHLASTRSMLKARDLTIDLDALATLGDRLALTRVSISASGVGNREIDVGPYRADQLMVNEIDADGRQLRSEMFAADRLSEAVVRLYERYAERMTDEPERDRATAIARSIGHLLAPLDPERWAAAISSEIEWDGRGPAAYPPGRGSKIFLEAVRDFLEVGTIETDRTDDVFALGPNALLRIGTTIGTDRAEGGSWEHTQIYLFRFGSDGLLARIEYFQPDHVADALARFDALSAGPMRPARRIRRNAATAQIDRIARAIESRDTEAIAREIPDGYEMIEHTTGAVYDHLAPQANWRLLLQARDLSYRSESVATLGETLAVCRISLSATGSRGRRYDVGPYSAEQWVVVEVDARGLQRRAELYSVDRLGDAMVRLFERYAESLPPGPGRERAAATASSVALLRENPDRWVFAEHVELIDHRSVGIAPVRGRQAVIDSVRALFDLIESSSAKWDDVLAVRPDAIVTLRTHSGTDRATGGAFERSLCVLVVFDSDGLVSRWERFDPQHAADALARFDALTPEPARHARRVRSNCATANIARAEESVVSCDLDAFAELFAESYESVDHVNHLTYDRAAMIATLRLFTEAVNRSYRHEPLATIGDSLVLCRLQISASGSGGKLDAGAYDYETLLIAEVDAQGKRTRAESFALDRLGDAVVRLYERYAELLPAGPERERAAAVARSVLPSIAPDPSHFGARFASGVEFVDHRALIGLPSARGAEELRQRARSWFDGVDDHALSIEDLVDLRPDGLIRRMRERGRDRNTGGAFEGGFLVLHVFDREGDLGRIELFELDHAAEALARFDALTSTPARRVRPNAATAHAARLDAAIAARNVEAIAGMLSERSRLIDYTTGAAYDDRAGALATFDALWESQNPRYRSEPLASLDDSLALCRITASGSGTAQEHGFGAWELDRLGLLEVDVEGRRQRMEIFAGDRLGDAIVRLYERYSEILPDGPDHERAASTACSIAALFAPLDPDRWATAIADDVEFADHRSASFPSGRGAADLLSAARVSFEVAEQDDYHVEDVLDLRPNGIVVKSKNTGIVRASGGDFETAQIALYTFGHDGLLTRIEAYESDRPDDALARFDEVTTQPALPVRRVRPNAVTAKAARIEAAVESGDLAAVSALISPDCEVVDHPNGATYDREGTIATLRPLLRARDVRYRNDPVATLGDFTALLRISISTSGLAGNTYDVGPYENEQLFVNTTDATGQRWRTDVFAGDHLGNAIARLYERYAELLPEGPERDRATLIARAMPAVIMPRREGFGAHFAPEIEFIDHRQLIQLPSGRGADALRKRAFAWFEGIDDYVQLPEDVLDLRPDGLLCVMRERGRDRASGGAFEGAWLNLTLFGRDGLQIRTEMFDVDRVGDALARFDTLCAERDPLRIPPNAASRAVVRAMEVFADREVGPSATLRDDFVFEDRGRRALVSGGPEQGRATLEFYQQQGGHPTRELIGTRGDRISIERNTWSGSGFEIDYIGLVEVDEAGKIRTSIRFDADDRAAAFAEAEQRFLAGEAAGIAGQTVFAELDRTAQQRDWEAMRRCLTDDFATRDHRVLGVGAESGDELIASLRAQAELSPDVDMQVVRILEWNARGRVVVMRRSGTALHGGGAFESYNIAVWLTRGDRAQRVELFDIGDADAALARFAELCAERDPMQIPPNAATRARESVVAAATARDTAALRALLSDDFVWQDRGKRALIAGDVVPWAESIEFYQSQGGRQSRERIGTRGDRIEIVRVTWAGIRDGSEFEIEFISLAEVDAQGKLRALIRFDADDRSAAFEEAEERFLAGEAAPIGGQAPIAALRRAVNTSNWEALRRCYADDFVNSDHRTLGVGAETADELIASLRAQAELSPDAQIEAIRILTWNRHGQVAIMRAFGSAISGGGPFENVLIPVYFTLGDRIQRLEMFDIGDADAALARFAELCAER